MAMTGPSHVLIVAGSDSSGGAGIARDVETAAAFGLRACLAITAVTVQTHDAVGAVEIMSPTLVEQQMRAALEANSVKAIKIGMLATAEIIEVVASVLRDHAHIPAILDPVLASSSGRPLLEPHAVELLKRELMPLCRLMTPNLIELAILTRQEPAPSEAAAIRQGEMLLREGCPAVLIKGGHASGAEATDILLTLPLPLNIHGEIGAVMPPPSIPPHKGEGGPTEFPSPLWEGIEGGGFEHRPQRATVDLTCDAPAQFFTLPRLDTEMRGTGCILASAIASVIARGENLKDAVRIAKEFLYRQLSSDA